MKTINDQGSKERDMSNWRPINTAPRDGSEFLVCSADAYRKLTRMVANICTARWNTVRNQIEPSWGYQRVIESQSDFGTDYADFWSTPTHWAPFPEFDGE